MRGQETVGAVLTSPRLAYVIGRLDDVLRRKVNEGVKPYGLTARQYVALSILRTRTGLSNAQLARRSFMTPQSMGEVIQALEQKGYVRRVSDRSNPRIRRAELTAAGRRAVSAGDRVVDALEEQMTRGLAPHDLEKVVSGMKSFVTKLGGGLANV
jgi:DNA-binding MarR family transcriptional regulator